MSKRLRYGVAVSLDGFIAGPNGEADWIVMDPSIDFEAMFKQFDTVVMGRKTYEVVTAAGGSGAMPGMEVVVFSRTLPPSARKGVRVVNDDPRAVVAELKSKPGRDIWLFGGGVLFRSLLDAGLVDSVEIAVVPVLLGSGVPLLPPGGTTKLVLADQKSAPGQRHRRPVVLGARRIWSCAAHWVHQVTEAGHEEEDNHEKDNHEEENQPQERTVMRRQSLSACALIALISWSATSFGQTFGRMEVRAVDSVTLTGEQFLTG